MSALVAHAMDVPPDCRDAEDPAHALRSLAEVVAPRASPRLNVDPANVKRGVGQLVLTLVKLLHELLERQAIRRIDAGSLTDKQIEDVGLTLMRQAEEIERLARDLGLDVDDLTLDLGPIGKLL